MCVKAARHVVLSVINIQVCELVTTCGCDGSSISLGRIKSENMFESIDNGDRSGRKLIASEESPIICSSKIYTFNPDGHFVNFVRFLTYLEKRK